MGHKQDIEEALKDCHIKCIDGQPTDEDLTRLESELSAMAASIPTTNGWGLHGHVSMLCEDSDYTSFSHIAESFTIPTNPGPYPTTVDPTNAIVRAWQEAEHKVHVKSLNLRHTLGLLNPST